MKNLLILATPRSGSSALYQALSSNYFEYHSYYEPWSTYKKGSWTKVQMRIRHMKRVQHHGCEGVPGAPRLPRQSVHLNTV